MREGRTRLKALTGRVEGRRGVPSASCEEEGNPGGGFAAGCPAKFGGGGRMFRSGGTGYVK